ncbi:Ku protein [Streptomyces sp. NPDC127051]|uniref:non-homologous end joining protein Ku n=1 Tax=Streptomyces sp. NPDC127051 TaxID=3347119 RepID=UPI00364F1254
MSRRFDLTEVDRALLDKIYWMGLRGAEHGKVYSLLEQALEKSGKAGIATFVMRQHKYLVAVTAENGLLTCHTLHWADEIRDPKKEISNLPGKVNASAKELKMAEQLIDALSMEWNPEEFHDTFQEKVAALIQAKQAGETVEKAEPPARPTGAVDLMEALRASVERARSLKDTGEKATTAASPQRKKATPAKKRVTSKGESLQSLTKAELYKKAAAAHVPGRSTMTHDQLVDALTDKASSRS